MKIQGLFGRGSVLLVAGTICLAGGTGLALADEEEQEIAWDEAPEAVRATIEANLAEAVGGVITVETEDGVTIYEAEIVNDGVETSIEVSETGEVLEVETEDQADDDDADDEDDGEDDDVKIPWAEAPEAVRAAIEASLPAAVGSAIEVEVEDGITIYEAEIEADGMETSVEVNASGEVLEIEQEAIGSDDDQMGDDDDDDDEDEDDDD